MKLKTLGIALFCCFALSIIFSSMSTIFVGIQKAVIKHPGAILIVPGEFSIYLSGVILALSLLALFLAISNTDVLKHPKNRKQLPQPKFWGLLLIYLAAAAGFFIFFTNFFRYTELFYDHIQISNGIIPHIKKYHYSDIVEVSLGYFHGLYYNEPEYDLQMSDGTKVNIAAVGIHPNLFYAIELAVPKTVRRVCQIGGRRYIVNKMPDDIRAFYEEKYHDLK